MSTIRQDVPFELFSTEHEHNTSECEDWCQCAERPWFIADAEDGTRTSYTFRTKREAKEWLRDMVAGTPLTEADFRVGRIKDDRDRR